jgi:hypothetical protein
VEDSCEYGNESSGSIKCLEFLSSCVTGDFSRRARPHEVRQNKVKVKLSLSLINPLKNEFILNNI